MFGTFEPEGERVRYGLTKNIETFNPVRVAYGEFAALWRDVKAAKSWRARAGSCSRARDGSPGPALPTGPSARPRSPPRRLA